MEGICGPGWLRHALASGWDPVHPDSHCGSLLPPPGLQAGVGWGSKAEPCNEEAGVRFWF